MNQTYWLAQVAVARHFMAEMNDAILDGFNALDHKSPHAIAVEMKNTLESLRNNPDLCEEWAGRYGARA